MTGIPFAIPTAPQRWRPPREVSRRPGDLHAAAIRMATARPLVLTDIKPPVGWSSNRSKPIVECWSEGSADMASTAARRHQAVMVQFERLLQTQPNREAHITKICAALGVSARRLRSLRPASRHEPDRLRSPAANGSSPARVAAMTARGHIRPSLPVFRRRSGFAHRRFAAQNRPREELLRVLNPATAEDCGGEWEQELAVTSVLAAVGEGSYGDE